MFFSVPFIIILLIVGVIAHLLLYAMTKNFQVLVPYWYDGRFKIMPRAGMLRAKLFTNLYLYYLILGFTSLPALTVAYSQYKYPIIPMTIFVYYCTVFFVLILTVFVHFLDWEKQYNLVLKVVGRIRITYTIGAAMLCLSLLVIMFPGALRYV